MITQDLIKRFDACLKKYCQYAYRYYDSPLSEREILDYMSQLGMDTEREIDFKSLYEWKNGISIEVQDYSIDMSITIAGNFVSLKEALIIYKNNLKNNWWKKTLVPLIVNYEGEHLLIETDETSLQYKFIYFYSPSILPTVDAISYYDSLELMLETIIVLFEQRVQVYDEDAKFLDIDLEKGKVITQSLNPGSEYWKLIDSVRNGEG